MRADVCGKSWTNAATVKSDGKPHNGEWTFPETNFVKVLFSGNNTYLYLDDVSLVYRDWAYVAIGQAHSATGTNYVFTGLEPSTAYAFGVVGVSGDQQTQPSISAIVRRARLRTESTIGRRVSLCVSPALTNASLISCSPSVIAALAVFADESSASIFNFGTPLQSNYAFILVIILGYRNSNRIFGQTVLDIFAPLNHEHAAHIEIIKKSG